MSIDNPKQLALSFGDQTLQKRQKDGFGEFTGVEHEADIALVADHAPESAIADYAKRWGIETLFGCFKTCGFCVESTHFNQPERLSKLIALLSLGMCWAMLTGIWLNLLNPIKIKKHGRMAKSIFRFGLDFLRNTFFDLKLNADAFSKALSFLSCT
jgi:hypothetical protein